MNQLISVLSSAAVVALLMAGCAGPDAADPTAANGSSPSPSSSAPMLEGLPSVGLPVAEGADVHGLVPVNGHDLAVNCTGTGHPTVVVLHGWIDEPGVRSFDYYGPLSDELKPDFRVCSYAHANVGDSETVRGT